jgi:hypothetical protein
MHRNGRRERPQCRSARPCTPPSRPVHRLTFQSYGVRLAVEVDDPCTIQLIREHLPFGWEPAPDGDVARCYSLRTETGTAETGPPNSIVLRRDGTELLRIDNLSEALELLESLLQTDVAEMARARVFVHAGVVGWKGRAILLPGPSFSGKSSLVTALVRAGATYYSDEFAVLDAQGQVHPFARPLSLRPDGSARGEKHTIESLGGRAGKEPLPVGLVVVSRFRVDARWRPRRLSAAQGALALLANTVPARHKPRVVIATLETVVREATVVQGTRGDAHEAAGPILRLLERRMNCTK